jgi:nucleoside-diphosphate-sugar epimerase
VRDPAALKEAFEGADVVVHLAFMITGTASARTIREINIEGTANAFRAARAAGAERFVYASSVAAYGFHRDNPVGMTEDWPTRPAARLFYAREKAEVEKLLREEAERGELPALYMVRPPIVLGPHAVGAKDALPEPLARAGRQVLGVVGRLPIPVPVLAPGVQLQFIHEDDVGRALLQCVLGAGPPGAYNIAGDGVLSGADVARELGFTPVPIPGGLVHGVARAAAAALPPFAPPSTEWVEAISQPSIMDTEKARRELGWTPQHSGLDALRETVRAARGEAD